MRIIGMISGTSFDAVEALLADLELDGDRLVCDLVEHRSVPYPASVRHEISAMLPPSPTRSNRSAASTWPSASSSARWPRNWPTNMGRGRHLFARPNPLPLGRRRRRPGHATAGRAGLDRRTDGRRHNKRCPQPGHRRRGPRGAAGQLLDVLLLAPPHRGMRLAEPRRHRQRHRARARPGAARLRHRPSNALIDAAVEMLTDGAQGFDRDGAWAARGRADAALVESLLDDPYFALPPPKSTGKEYFNLGYVTKRLKGREISAEDLLASLTVTTAESWRRPSVRSMSPSSSWLAAAPATSP